MNVTSASCSQLGQAARRLLGREDVLELLEVDRRAVAEK